MAQDGSLDFRLVQRVCALQQALDQALYSLTELRAQLQDQQWLESQLAKTEKYANVQQQAIAALKHQLHQTTGQQHQLLHLLGLHLEQWVETQQITLNRLQLQLDQGEAELQAFLNHLSYHTSYSPLQSPEPTPPEAPTSVMLLEAELMVARSVAINLGSQLQTTRQHIHALGNLLNYHYGPITQAATRLHTLFNATTEGVGYPPALEAEAELAPAEAPLALPPPDEAQGLRQVVRAQRVRLQELETALAEQFACQTQLKQRCQALAAERDYYKRQVEALQSSDLPSPPESATMPLWQRRLRLQPQPPIQPLQVDEVSFLNGNGLNGSSP